MTTISDVRRRGLSRELITDLYDNGEIPGTPLADQLRGAADYEAARARVVFERHSALITQGRVPAGDPIAAVTANELVESARRDLAKMELVQYMLPNGGGGVLARLPLGLGGDWRYGSISLVDKGCGLELLARFHHESPGLLKIADGVRDAIGVKLIRDRRFDGVDDATGRQDYVDQFGRALLFREGEGSTLMVSVSDDTDEAAARMMALYKSLSYDEQVRASAEKSRLGGDIPGFTDDPRFGAEYYYGCRWHRFNSHWKLASEATSERAGAVPKAEIESLGEWDKGDLGGEAIEAGYVYAEIGERHTGARWDIWKVAFPFRWFASNMNPSSLRRLANGTSLRTGKPSRRVHR